jgi:hypothetical protein
MKRRRKPAVRCRSKACGVQLSIGVFHELVNSISDLILRMQIAKPPRFVFRMKLGTNKAVAVGCHESMKQLTTSVGFGGELTRRMAALRNLTCMVHNMRQEEATSFTDPTIARGRVLR